MQRQRQRQRYRAPPPPSRTGSVLGVLRQGSRVAPPPFLSATGEAQAEAKEEQAPDDEEEKKEEDVRVPFTNGAVADGALLLRLVDPVLALLFRPSGCLLLQQRHGGPVAELTMTSLVGRVAVFALPKGRLRRVAMELGTEGVEGEAPEEGRKQRTSEWQRARLLAVLSTASAASVPSAPLSTETSAVTITLREGQLEEYVVLPLAPADVGDAAAELTDLSQQEAEQTLQLLHCRLRCEAGLSRVKWQYLGPSATENSAMRLCIVPCLRPLSSPQPPPPPTTTTPPPTLPRPQGSSSSSNMCQARLQCQEHVLNARARVMVLQFSTQAGLTLGHIVAPLSCDSTTLSRYATGALVVKRSCQQGAMQGQCCTVAIPSVGHNAAVHLGHDSYLSSTTASANERVARVAFLVALNQGTPRLDAPALIDSCTVALPPRPATCFPQAGPRPPLTVGGETTKAWVVFSSSSLCLHVSDGDSSGQWEDGRRWVSLAIACTVPASAAPASWRLAVHRCASHTCLGSDSFDNPSCHLSCACTKPTDAEVGEPAVLIPGGSIEHISLECGAVYHWVLWTSTSSSSDSSAATVRVWKDARISLTPASDTFSAPSCAHVALDTGLPAHRLHIPVMPAPLPRWSARQLLLVWRAQHQPHENVATRLAVRVAVHSALPTASSDATPFREHTPHNPAVRGAALRIRVTASAWAPWNALSADERRALEEEPALHSGVLQDEPSLTRLRLRPATLCRNVFVSLDADGSPMQGEARWRTTQTYNSEEKGEPAVDFDVPLPVHIAIPAVPTGLSASGLRPVRACMTIAVAVWSVPGNAAEKQGEERSDATTAASVSIATQYLHNTHTELAEFENFDGADTTDAPPESVATSECTHDVHFAALPALTPPPPRCVSDQFHRALRVVSDVVDDEEGLDLGSGNKGKPDVWESTARPFGWLPARHIFDEPLRLFTTRDGLSASSIMQGRLGNCWLVHHMVSLALFRPDELRTSLGGGGSGGGGGGGGGSGTNEDEVEDGKGDGAQEPLFQVRLYVRGEWKLVHVDTCLPCDVYGLPLCAKSRIAGELWVSLLEKAFAVACGGYEATVGIRDDVSLLPLATEVRSLEHLRRSSTTAPEETKLEAGSEAGSESESVRSFASAHELWRALQSFVQVRWLVGVRANADSVQESSALVPEHAYVVVRLLEGMPASSPAASGVDDPRMHGNLVVLQNTWGHTPWEASVDQYALSATTTTARIGNRRLTAEPEGTAGVDNNDDATLLSRCWDARASRVEELAALADQLRISGRFVVTIDELCALFDTVYMTAPIAEAFPHQQRMRCPLSRELSASPTPEGASSAYTVEFTCSGSGSSGSGSSNWSDDGTNDLALFIQASLRGSDGGPCRNRVWVCIQPSFAEQVRQTAESAMLVTPSEPGFVTAVCRWPLEGTHAVCGFRMWLCADWKGAGAEQEGRKAEMFDMNVNLNSSVELERVGRDQEEVPPREQETG